MSLPGHRRSRVTRPATPVVLPQSAQAARACGRAAGRSLGQRGAPSEGDQDDAGAGEQQAEPLEGLHPLA
jgi:hypothetical protein